jgi:ABC-type sulfate transport system permease component
MTVALGTGRSKAFRLISFSNSNFVKLLIGIFLFVTVICPLASMLMNMAGSDISAVLQLPRFRESLQNSIVAATIGAADMQ